MVEFIAAFAAGWFAWVFFAVIIIWMLFLSNDENWFLSILAVIVGALYFGWINDFNVFTYALNHPKELMSCAAIYLIIGVAWTYFKWSSFVNKKLIEFNKLYSSFIKENTIKDGIMNDRQFSSFAYMINCFAHKSSFDREDMQNIQKYIAPDPSDNKAKIMYWIAWWPTSLVWSVFDDLFREIIESVYNAIYRSLKSISERRFASVEINLSVKEIDESEESNAGHGGKYRR